MDFVFPAGSNSSTLPRCLEIEIKYEGSSEEDETFTVALTISTSESVVALGNNATIVTITNAGGKYYN